MKQTLYFALSLILTAPVFYQLDYRERVGVELDVAGLAGLEVTKSFEVRYRPKAKTANSEKRSEELSNDKTSERL